MGWVGREANYPSGIFMPSCLSVSCFTSAAFFIFTYSLLPLADNKCHLWVSDMWLPIFAGRT